MELEERIKEKLKQVKDPHIGINVVDLGFIRQIEIKDKEAKIKITLTTPACPMAQMIMNNIKQKAEETQGIEKAEVQLETDPLWTPEEMSNKAKEKLKHLF